MGTLARWICDSSAHRVDGVASEVTTTIAIELRACRCRDTCIRVRTFEEIDVVLWYKVQLYGGIMSCRAIN